MQQVQHTMVVQFSETLMEIIEVNSYTTLPPISSILFDGWSMPSSKWSEIIKWGIIVIVGIPIEDKQNFNANVILVHMVCDYLSTHKRCTNFVLQENLFLSGSGKVSKAG